MGSAKLTHYPSWRAHRSRPVPTRERRPGILVVDDNAGIRALLQHLLRFEEFTVWLASGGADAIKVFHRHGHRIDLVLLDVQMPGLDGPRTLAAIQQMAPEIPALFMSGDSGGYSEQELQQRGALRLLRKPFRRSELIGALRELCARLKSAR